MAWIRVPDSSEIDRDSRLARLLRSAAEPETGQVDEILAVHGLRPETLDAHLRLYSSAMRPADPRGLSARERELVAVVVSAANGCAY